MNTPSPGFSRVAFREERGGFSLTLKRNCSISPAMLARVYAALALTVLGIGCGFALAGAWLVLPFAGLEAVLLGIAFWLYARQAADYERIELAQDRLTVEVAEAQRTERYVIDPRGARICIERGSVLLRAAQVEVEIGRHLDAEARIEFAAKLAKRLRI